MDHTVGQSILVFLPPTAARAIARKLHEHGYRPIIACTLADLQRQLPAADYSLVIATRPDIDIVRSLKPLPVLNLEIFFHFDRRQNSANAGTQTFDGPAFLARVKALTGSRPSTARSQIAAVAQARKRAPWTLSATALLRQVHAVLGRRYEKA